LFGILVAVLGGVLITAGLHLAAIGGNGLYFIVAGIGIGLSGCLVAAGLLLGVWVYAATLIVMIIWSFMDLGPNAAALLPRLVMPILIGLGMVSSRVRPHLR